MPQTFPLTRTLAARVFLLVPLLLVSATRVPATQRLSAQEVIARHLASLGTPEERAAFPHRVISGSVAYTARAPRQGLAGGTVKLSSAGRKSAVEIVTDHIDYPFDKFAFDGERVRVSRVRPGVRTPLGSFLEFRGVAFKDGLFGGALSTAWVLLDPDERRARIEYAGEGTLDGRGVYKLSYWPRKGFEMRVTLYFDAETFRHVRTEYRERSNAGYRLVEDFWDFRREGYLTLPHRYRIELVSEQSRAAAFWADWEMTLRRFDFSRPVAPEEFEMRE